MAFAGGDSIRTGRVKGDLGIRRMAVGLRSSLGREVLANRAVVTLCFGGWNLVLFFTGQ